MIFQVAKLMHDSRFDAMDINNHVRIVILCTTVMYAYCKLYVFVQ